MNVKDIITVNVVGTNGSKQTSLTIAFNGLGQPIDSKGKVVKGNVLKGLPDGGNEEMPPPPTEEITTAFQAGKLEEVKKLMQAYQTQLEQAAAAGGGSEELQLLDAIFPHLTKFHDFHEEDGEWFVLKRDACAVTKDTLPNGGRWFNVMPRPVFGDK